MISFTLCRSLRTKTTGASVRFLNAFSQDDVPSRFQLCILILLKSRLTRCIFFDRKYILYHTHFRSGNTSHDPFSPVPPQGPLRIRFGQFCEQINAVEDNMHSPQRWQRNRGIFMMSSTTRRRRETFRSPAPMGCLFCAVESVANDVLLAFTIDDRCSPAPQAEACSDSADIPRRVKKNTSSLS